MTEGWAVSPISLRQSFDNGGDQAIYSEEFWECIKAFWEWVKAG